MKEMKIIYKNIEDIIPYENNPRHNENAVDYVANSIKEFGFKVPIIIDKENVVVTGHTRLKASEKLGIKKVPVIMASDLTEEQIKAFQKAWRKGNPNGKVVLLTPHYWVIDTKTKTFERELPLQRPKIDLQIWKVNSDYWEFYKPHYYLDLPMPIASEYFIGVVDGELACHLAISPMFQCGGYRGTRLVTMPEWQGAGVGSRFLNFMGQYCLKNNI